MFAVLTIFRFADVFFHCDQLIRGIYEPFVAEWKSAFPSSVHVMRAEDLIDRNAESRRQLFAFLGVPMPSGGRALTAGSSAPLMPASYAEIHARSMAKDMNGNKVQAVPMHEHTRAALHGFYRPHTHRLAQLLGRPDFEWTGNGSRVVLGQLARRGDELRR